MTATLDFDLPAVLEASEPPEVRGRGRDDVRLLVSRRRGTEIEHRRFTELPELLRAGDLLVVNTSATLPAALDARADPPGAGGSHSQPAVLHLATPLDEHHWVVELRHRSDRGVTPWLDAPAGTVVRLRSGGRARLLDAAAPLADGRVRLWRAALDLPCPVDEYLADHGRPIRYGYVPRQFPIDAYQTVFADEPGSAEMPSAARPFTAGLVTRLVTAGIGVAPLVLHTGVSSPEVHEPPSAERFRVPAATAERVNATHRLGGRVVAVGTTAVRALESAVDERGLVLGTEGWTELVIGPGRPVRAVDGMITGWHEPRASHLAMLEAVAGRPLLEASYRAALEEGYLWHEFGDSHLILP
jgi:S-adenosylmethionine:tRNA ribosyltransferase-isomerase